MQSEAIIKYKKKNIAQIYLNISYSKAINKSQLVFYLSKDIEESAIGYAGFKTKYGLQKHLTQAIFDLKKISRFPQFNFDKKKIVKIITNTIISCYKILPYRPAEIFVFPTFSKFVKKKMSGTTGYTPWKNTILIFINPSSSTWEKALPATIAHEFNHSVILQYHQWRTLLDSLIFEGLAEHFIGDVINGKRALWTRSLSIKQSKKLFLELKKYLYSKDSKLYQSIFFGDRKYRQWAGYTLGYYIVQSFIKNNPGFSWKRIVTLPPKEILQKSNFIEKSPK